MILNHKITLIHKDNLSGLTELIYEHFQLVQTYEVDRIELSAFLSKEDDYTTSQLLIFVSDGMSFQELRKLHLFCDRHSIPCLSVGSVGNKIILGPSYTTKSCANSVDAYVFITRKIKKENIQFSPQYTLDHILAEEINKSIPLQFNLLSNLVREADAILNNKLRAELVNTIEIIDKRLNSGKSNKQYIPPSPAKDVDVDKLPAYPALLSSVSKSKNLHLNKHLMHRNSDMPDMYKNVCIVGGGTAGYLTALGLKASFPNLDITLIESSKVPVIGVGEATLPTIRTLLFETLKLDKKEFLEKVEPTWKLGIKFLWGQPGDYYFNFPFGTFDILSSYLANGDINSSSLVSVLMNNQKSFVTHYQNGKSEDNSYHSLKDNIDYAFHLNNKKFVQYLHDKVIEKGIQLIDDLIVDHTLEKDTGNISALKGESGESYEFEFYVDCSGFKSILLHKVFSTPYIDYSDVLYTNRAITGHIPNGERINPYTIAQTMNHGWCWHVPLRNEQHLGYVYSADFASDDEAASELEQKFGITDPRKIFFRSGRYAKCIHKNVMAIGNSYAFVEPLESTGIGMISKSIYELTSHFKDLKHSTSVRDIINQNLNDRWDYLRDFLGLHFKYNKKLDTSFWQACRADINLERIDWLVDLYKERGLLSYMNPIEKSSISNFVRDDIFGVFAIDIMLLGQGVLPKNIDNLSFKNRRIWNAIQRDWERISQFAIPVNKDQEVLLKNPHLF